MTKDDKFLNFKLLCFLSVCDYIYYNRIFSNGKNNILDLNYQPLIKKRKFPYDGNILQLDNAYRLRVAFL